MSAWQTAKEIIEVAFQKKGREFPSIILFWAYCVFYIFGISLLRDLLPAVEWQLLIFLVASVTTPMVLITIFNVNTVNSEDFKTPIIQVLKNKVIWKRALKSAPLLFVYTLIFYGFTKYAPGFVMASYRDSVPVMVVFSLFFVATWLFYYISLWLSGPYILTGFNWFQILAKTVKWILGNFKLSVFVFLRLSKYFGFALIGYSIIFLICSLIDNSQSLFSAMLFQGNIKDNWLLKVALILPVPFLYIQIYKWVVFFTHSYSRQVFVFFDPEVFKE